LSPASGSKYYYEIKNESEIRAEIGNKKTDNQKKSTLGVSYEINKDSSEYFLVNLSYDKIHLYSKAGSEETDIDAANAET